MATVGLVTIGQAPREDIREELLSALGERADVVEAGALDGLERKALGAVRTRGEGDVLVTRLADGADIKISEGRVIPLVETAIERVEAAGADFTVVMCTGSFPPLRHRRPLLVAGDVLPRAVAALTSTARVGLLLPDARQSEAGREKWAGVGVEVALISWASPYAGDMTELGRAATELSGADVIVMDCMGYTEAMARRVREASGRPALLARRVVGKLAGLLLD